MEKHFKLTDETYTLKDGTILYRIECIKPIPNRNIAVGTKGGFVENESNLAGNAWIANNAKVYGNARVFGNAFIFCNAQVYGDAEVFGNAMVYDTAEVYGHARAYDCARVLGNAKVYDYASVHGSVKIQDNTRIYEHGVVSGSAMVCHDAQVHDFALVYGNECLCQNADIKGIKDVCNFSGFGDDIAVITAFRCADGVVRIKTRRGVYNNVNEFAKDIEKHYRGTEYLGELLAIVEVIQCKFILD